MKKAILKNTYIVFSCVYTGLTLFSSVVNLMLGRTEDSYLHLIDRAVIILIPILFYFLVNQLKTKPYLKILIHYVSTVLLVMLATFVIGLITNDLAPTAYRDQFLNYSIAYIIIVGVIVSSKKTKNLKPQPRPFRRGIFVMSTN